MKIYVVHSITGLIALKLPSSAPFMHAFVPVLFSRDLLGLLRIDTNPVASTLSNNTCHCCTYVCQVSNMTGW